jgi:hypothetical protein
VPELEQDPLLIERLALIHEGNAAAHAHRTAGSPNDLSRGYWSTRKMLAASSSVIAASYWALIAPTRAIVLYRQAAQLYRAMGHMYWIVLALAGADRDGIAGIPSAVDPKHTYESQSIAFAMVGNEIAESNSGDSVRDGLKAQWRHLGNVPVGRLGIPLDYYGRCAEAIYLARRERNSRRFIVESTNYLSRAAEVVRRASHDRFHWLRLQSAILPAEPEAVAMTATISMISQAIFDRAFDDMVDLDYHSRLLVQVGGDLWKAAHGGHQP